MGLSILDYLRNAIDYFRCNLAAHAACYRAIYFAQEEVVVGHKKHVNVTMYPVVFEEGDQPNVPNCKIIPDTDILEANIIEDMILDRNKGVVMILDARLYGKSCEQVSLWDICRNRRKRSSMIYSLIKYIVYLGEEDVRLCSIRGNHPIAYKELPHLIGK